LLGAILSQAFRLCQLKTGCKIATSYASLNLRQLGIDQNATIEYNYLDYWDVPDEDVSLNPPTANSAPVKNPK